MPKKILLVLASAAVALGILIWTRLWTFHVERSIEITAQPATVFRSVDELRGEVGKGAGKGKLTITESRPPWYAGGRLELSEPVATAGETAFDLKPFAGATWITWSIDGDNNLVGKAFWRFMNMDKVIGKNLEDGLATLKRRAEADAAAEQKAMARAAAEIAAGRLSY